MKRHGGGQAHEFNAGSGEGYAIRAVQFKKERGRIPALDSQDAWERRMAEGAAAFMRFKAEGRYEQF
ncbi:hypothetical protein [Burkholderia plantarii]|uniref:hypothetical protein n=1 Tax=Burkholderia plantarii TaxID=41899 RepID=UPI0018DB010A|nr:hypothetical protein [Burkholderia plantarii]MBI0328341.1 hypothetical protein [Burkholderia plantarii]